MKKVIVLLLILSSTSIFAQTKKFRWSSETCEFEGTYNSAKYSQIELKNTYELVRLLNSVHTGLEGVSTLPASSDPIEKQYAEIATYNVETLDKKYVSTVNQIKNLKLVKSAYWESQRQQKLKDLEQTYQFYRTTILAWNNPSVIKNYKSADVCVGKYANPLMNGGDQLLNTWLMVNKETRRNNGAPQLIEEKFNNQMNSSDKLRYARMEVMIFGWWNCANGFLNHSDNYDQQNKEFKKLFTRTRTISCDEP